MSERTTMSVMIPQEIPTTSWLNEPKYQWFRNGYNYATTQNAAIPALSKCRPDELYNALWAIMRGAKIPIPKDAPRKAGGG